MEIKPTSIIDYRKQLISSEESEKKKGYSKRVEQLREMKLSEERKMKALQ